MRGRTLKRRDFLGLIPIGLGIGKFTNRIDTVSSIYSISIPFSPADDFFINVHYLPDWRDNRSAQYFLMVPDDPKFLLRDRAILGGYHYSKLKYKSKEVAGRNVIFHFNVDLLANAKYKAACDYAGLEYVPFGDTLEIYIRQYTGHKEILTVKRVRVTN